MIPAPVTARRKERQPRVASIYVQQCDGQLWQHDGPFTKGEVNELLNQYLRTPTADGNACQVALVDETDSAIVRWERWQAKAWHRTPKPRRGFLRLHSR